MPGPGDPVHPMNSLIPVTIVELEAVIKRSKSLSAPSPVDQISYQIFKRCPSLYSALLDLFNGIIAEGSVPSSWKIATFKLFGKAAAVNSPDNPRNFRPIALTSAIS